MPEWKSYLGKGLKESNEEFNKFLFLNEANALLLGTNYTDEVILQKKFDQQNAVVYRSSDSAKSWSETVIGKGRLRDAVYVNDVIFALSNRTEKGNENSIVYISRDKGFSWDTLTVFPLMVRDIVFADSLNGIVVCKDSSSKKRWTVLQTINGGKHWSKILEEDDVTNVVFFKESVSYVTTLDNGQETVASFDIPFKSKKLRNLPIEYEHRVITIDDKGKLWVAAINMKLKSISILSINENGSYSNIEVESADGCFPVSFSIKDEKISILAGKVNGGIVDYKFFQTINGGLNWVDEVPPISSYMNPIAYYKQSIWAYAGAGRIQCRK
jgi:hypothetical protein